MKSILIIGMGRFGRHLCKKFNDLENQVMIVDEQEDRINDMLPFATSAKIGDCTNEEVLRALGIGNFDMCFVCIGNNFQSSLEITSLVKELGGKYVISKANRDIHAKFLLRNGADEVIYPERDAAEKLAIRCSARNVFDYIELTEGYSIYEINVLPEWENHSISQLSIRTKYQISILGIKKEGKMKLMPSADYVLKSGDHLLVIGEKKNVHYLLKRM